MNFSSVLIVTYGRSGSTLLQGLLNSIDGCLVRGENYNFCYGLFESYNAIVKTKKEFGPKEETFKVTSPWYGASTINEEKFIEDARNLVINQLNPNKEVVKCIGFKEIRYFTAPEFRDKRKLYQYLDFLNKIFPSAAIIFLTRDIEAVVKSAWWNTKDTQEVKKNIIKFESNMESYCKNNKNTFHIDYQDMVNQTDVLKNMFLFLGVLYKDAIVKKVLSTKHSYQPKKPKIKKLYDIKYEQYSWVKHIKVDNNLTQNINEFVLSGVVLISKKNADLIVVDTKGEHLVEWNISSTNVAKRFPDNPDALKARFRVTDLKFNKYKPLKFYLKENEGKSYLMFTLFLKK